MAIDKFLIAPMKNGLQLNVRPWMIMDDAFVEFSNVHLWRERIKKRFGAISMNSSKANIEQQLFTRFRVKIGTTDGAGNLAVVVPGAIFKVGQIFSAGTEIYTVIALGIPTLLLSTGAGVATFNTTTGAFVLVGGPALTDVFFYPAEPVMALPTYAVDNINDEQLFGIDTQFAYEFAKATGWQRLGNAIWTGTNTDFHWTTNYRGAASSNYLLFVVNNVVADVIKYWDGAAWNNLSPIYNSVSGNVIRTAKIVIPYQDRLLLLNTTEQVGAGNSIFTNRIRWCQNGSPLTVDAWYENVPGKGGFLEAPVREAIISAGFLKDRLIVTFEQSTWELAYTGNQVLPFVFRRIDTTLGLESQNSLVTFDKVLVGMGSTGIHACNGMNVDRIDQMIPDIIFDISNSNNAPTRVTGIRDYFTQEIYWSYNSASKIAPFSETFPNNLLVYNYITSAWATYDDSITAFGYYQNESDFTWDDLDMEWQEAAFAWDDPSLQSLFRQVVAGNQEGFTFIVSDNVTKNAKSLSITDITVVANVVTITAIDHNLSEDSFIFIENVVGSGTMPALNDSIFKVNDVISSSQFNILVNGIAGTYNGGGTITLVSRISFRSKAYNFYNQAGKNTQIPRVDFLVDVTDAGQILFDYSPSFSELSLVDQSQVTNTVIGTSILETAFLRAIEQTQQMAWRNMYPVLEGETVQYRLYLTNDQMLDPDIAFSAFQLHAVIFYARMTNDFGF